jgi:hypothetical protein
LLTREAERLLRGETGSRIRFRPGRKGAWIETGAVGEIAMPKRLLNVIVKATTVAIGAMGVNAASAAELAIPGGAAHWHHYRHYQHVTCWDCCCLHVRYVRHRQVESTYGTGFDPRNYDETEPHFYLGRGRTYARYWVEVVRPVE